MYIQIKSRFTLTKKEAYRSQIRKKSFVPRKDLYLAFVYCDSNTHRLGEILWLIPTIEFSDLMKGQSPGRKVYVFQSKFTSPNDMWVKYRLPLAKLPDELMALLDETHEKT